MSSFNKEHWDLLFLVCLLLPQVCSFLLNENFFINLRLLSSLTMNLLQARVGVRHSFTSYLARTKLFIWAPSVGSNHDPCVCRRILWDFLSLLPANQGENTFGHMDGYLSPSIPLLRGHKDMCWGQSKYLCKYFVNASQRQRLEKIILFSALGCPKRWKLYYLAFLNWNE